MLAMVIKLPPRRSAIYGANAPTRKYGARTSAANSRSKVASSRSAVGPESRQSARAEWIRSTRRRRLISQLAKF